MPYVNIRVTNTNVTTEQKVKLVKGVTDLLVDVLDKKPETTMVTIDEVEFENWGVGGELVSVIDARAKAGG